ADAISSGTPRLLNCQSLIETKAAPFNGTTTICRSSRYAPSAWQCSIVCDARCQIHDSRDGGAGMSAPLQESHTARMRARHVTLHRSPTFQRFQPVIQFREGRRDAAVLIVQALNGG